MSQEIIGKCLVLKCKSCKAETTMPFTEEIRRKIKNKSLRCPICGNYTEE